MADLAAANRSLLAGLHAWSIRTAWRRRDGLTSFPSHLPQGVDLELLVGHDPLQERVFFRSRSFILFVSSAFIAQYWFRQR